MQNIRLLIEYDGSDFYGWQIQPDLRTVQGEIEKALKNITNEEIKLIGAGRTDQGVHALGQVANFKIQLPWAPTKLCRALNSLTPDDIYIKHIDIVKDQFHSRYSARSKIYQYRITSIPSPFKIRYSWYINYRLNIENMKSAAKFLLGKNDYKKFSVSDGQKNTVCEIMKISLTERTEEIIIEFEGNRFLRKMVRGMVGFLVDVGRGRFQIENAGQIDNLKNLYFAPPQGLFLMKVNY